VIDQIPQNAIDRAAALEDIEDQLDCSANLFVRIERDLALLAPLRIRSYLLMFGAVRGRRCRSGPFDLV
jgi:hypothetical protein